MRFNYKAEQLGRFGLVIEAPYPGSKLDLNHEEFRAWIERAPLVLFRGFAKMNRGELIALSAKDSDRELLHWSFGPVMEVTPELEAKNYLFSREAVPFHWDGAFHRVPSHLVFHCLQAPSARAGGETLFSNTEAIFAEALHAEREAWSNTFLQYETEKIAHYGGSITIPMLDRHPRSGRPILRFAEPVATKRNPVALTVFGPHAKESDAFANRMSERLYHPRYLYEHQWREGDLLIADNFTLLHGRRALRENSPRHLRRVQIL